MGFSSVLMKALKSNVVEKIADKIAHDKMVDDAIDSTEYKRLTAADILKEKEEEKRKGYKKGGPVNESKMMKKVGRGMAKADMQKIASTAVKKHEKSMHGMKQGGYVKAADGCVKKGKTKGRMV